MARAVCSSQKMFKNAMHFSKERSMSLKVVISTQVEPSQKCSFSQKSCSSTMESLDFELFEEPEYVDDDEEFDEEEKVRLS